MEQKGAIYSVLTGGLGNQLFVIYTCMGKAIYENVEYFFIGEYDKNKGNISLHRKTYWETPIFKNISNHVRKFEDLNVYSLIEESKIGYVTELPSLKYCNDKNIMLLNGYWQCYLFFDKYNKEINNVLGISKITYNLKSKLPSTNKVLCSMHFRIGDYKKIQKRHPIMPLEYYKNALNHIVEHEKRDIMVLWYCHSPDITHVNNEYIVKLSSMFEQIEFKKLDKLDKLDKMDKLDKLDKLDNAYEELLLVSLCNHNIIANSTFSWWSAYLNNNANKIVCYPETWYGNNITNNEITNEQNKTRMFPKQWIKITFNYVEQQEKKRNNCVRRKVR